MITTDPLVLGRAIRSLPKAELHVHIEGTLEPELAFALAARNGIVLPFAGVEELRSAYRFGDLGAFLELYYTCMTVLRTRRDFCALATAYLDRAHEHGIEHVEMFFDPQVHARNGVSIDTVIDGLGDALSTAKTTFGISGGLILCFLRDQPVEQAMLTLESVARRTSDLIGVGLDSSEIGFPPALFRTVFARAAELGLHRVAHAGEEGPPSYIREAIEVLGAERIDHGVRAVEDAALVADLARTALPLTVCPLSNIALGVVSATQNHARALFDAGVVVTINSDDPAYFGGYIAENYEAVVASGFDLPELAELARNSITASFAGEERKAHLLTRVEDWERRSVTRDG